MGVTYATIDPLMVATGKIAGAQSDISMLIRSGANESGHSRDGEESAEDAHGCEEDIWKVDV